MNAYFKKISLDLRFVGKIKLNLQIHLSIPLFIDQIDENHYTPAMNQRYCNIDKECQHCFCKKRKNEDFFLYGRRFV